MKTEVIGSSEYRSSAVGYYCAIFVLISIYYVANFHLMNFDSLLAWPITDKIKNPGYFADGDILVKAGISGHFLLYRLLAAFPLFSNNYPLRDALLYLPIFFALVFAWYFVFYELTRDRFLSLVGIGIFLFANGKLGLNWAGTPLPYLVSYSSVHFAQVIALLLFLKKREFAAMLLLGLTSYFHPSTSMVYASIFMVIVAYESYAARAYRQLLPIAVYVVVLLPNIYLIMSNAQSAFNLFDQYFKIYENFAFHAYLEEHFREGYLYTLTLLGIILFCLKNATICEHQLRIRVLIYTALAGCALWLINLYFLRNLQVVHTYYVTRSFYWLKPLSIILFLCIVRNVGFRKHQGYVALPVIVTLMVFSPFFSLIVLASWLAYHMRPLLAPVVFVASVLTALLLRDGFDFSALLRLLINMPRDNSTVFSDSAQYLLLMPVIYLGARAVAESLQRSLSIGRVMPRSFKMLALASILAVACYAVSKRVLAHDPFPPVQTDESTNFGLATEQPEYSALLNWVKKSDGKLFVVPPNDQIFMSFRYITKKGVFIHLSDINQLSYSPHYYLEGFERIKSLGLEIHERHKYTWTGYSKVSFDYLRSKGVDYIIYDLRENPGLKPDVEPEYENSMFAVYHVTT